MQPDVPEFPRLFVGVGNTTAGDSSLMPLTRAVSDVRALAARVAELGFETACVLNPAGNGAARVELGDALPDGVLREQGGVLVLLWAGHAALNTNADALGLLTAGEGPGHVDALTPVNLADRASNTLASQILILVDTCFSGDAVIDAIGVTGRAALKHAEQRGRWAGVVASCQDFGRAVDGALVAKLLSLLDTGPSDPILRLRWSSYQAGLRGDDLVDALVKEWDQDRQFPKVHQQGDPWLVMANPLYKPGAQAQIVEHLLWSARGAAQTEQGNWFTGRDDHLKAVLSDTLGGDGEAVRRHTGW